MGLVIMRPSEPTGLLADRELWVDETKTVVVDGNDPRARFLFIQAGNVIPVADVQRLGLVCDKAGRISQGAPEPAEVEAPPPPFDENAPEEPEAPHPATGRSRRSPRG